MADDVNVKIKQTIKGNKFYGNSSIRSKFKMRFTLPADVIINIRARQKINKNNPKSNLKATQDLKVNNTEVKPNDK